MLKEWFLYNFTNNTYINIFNKEDGEIKSAKAPKYWRKTKKNPTIAISYIKGPNWQSYSLLEKRTLDGKVKT